MDIRQKLISKLADGRFHSGEVLAGYCGISRTAVWKHLANIKTQFGLEIYSVKGKGYRFAVPLELLDPNQIMSEISAVAKAQLSVLEIKEQIDSTNSYLMTLAMDEIESGHVCLAEQQTAGRGRQGRDWVSPYGNNIYLSIFWRFSSGLAGISGLSLAVGLIVAKILNQQGIENIGLKWPNDVLWRDRKLAGVLIEVTGEQGGPSNVVVGIGINSRMGDTHGETISQPWTDLATVTKGRVVSRNLYAARLIEGLVTGLDEFQTNGFAPLVEEWNRYDLHQGKRVELLSGIRRVVGIHRGVENSGALLLDVDGTTKAYFGGELSLRGAG